MHADLAEPLLGESPSIHSLRAAATSALRDRQPVLIQGEPGSRKGALARWLHQHGLSPGQPFLEVAGDRQQSRELEARIFGDLDPASSRPKGALPRLTSGTLFLNRADALPLSLQARLAGLLHSQALHPGGGPGSPGPSLRVIAATHLDLEDLVRKRLFRWDLYAQLRAHLLVVPPLRSRLEDVPALAARHLASRGRPEGTAALAPGALQGLRERSWPGNLEELEGCLDRALARAGGGPDQPVHLDLAPPAQILDREAARREALRREIQAWLQGAPSTA
ncbi:MAG: sigma 54-interacting transcriptional regulator [Holophagaceae bacterium]